MTTGTFRGKRLGSMASTRHRPKHRGNVQTNILSLEDDLLAIGKAVPAEEWAKLPKDFNENLDHYLYGSPKKKVQRPR